LTPCPNTPLLHLLNSPSHLSPIILPSSYSIPQVVASCLLLLERVTCRKRDFALCHKYNCAIGMIVIIIIVINILVTAFAGPGEGCGPNTNSTIHM